MASGVGIVKAQPGICSWHLTPSLAGSARRSVPRSLSPIIHAAVPARRDLGHAAWAVASRELCRSRIDANEKPIAESNLSLRVPAHVAAQCAIVSGCVHG